MQGRPEEFLSAGAELVAEALARFGQVRFRATGTSMLPALRPGDVLGVEACPVDQFHIGDIVVWNGATGLVAHRLVSNREHVAVTRGDANWQSDPPTSAARLLGRVTLVTRDGSPLSPATRGSWRSRAGALLRSESRRCSRRVRAIVARVVFQKRRSRTST
jgi:hypothetical protein